jgi:NAD(P)-dependent dehydrogenase (short-subunit alcohol dehydrogenase family)
MKDKICLITGATSGIGKAAAMQLAELGATLVLVGRNSKKTSATVKQVQEQTGNQDVHFFIADLSSQQAIRQLADDFKAHHQRLDVLVNNAGALMLSRQETVDGIEMTLALNHLSYFLLTNLLLDVLKSSSPSRIINVASDSHQNALLNFDDLQIQNGYRGYKAYGRSKLANMLFTYELARRLGGTGVTANGLHPGLVATSFLATNNGLRGRVFNFFVRRMGRSVENGARTITYLATSSDVEGVTAGYFMDEGVVDSSQSSYDKDASLRLWQVSEELTGLATDDGEDT